VAITCTRQKQKQKSNNLINGVRKLLENYLFNLSNQLNKSTINHRALSLIYPLVVYRSSETSTNQSDFIIRSDDRFLNLVVDSDSIVSEIYMLNFVLWLVFFSVSILTKILQFYPSWVFLPSYWQTSGNFVQAYFWHSVNTHIWTSLLFIYFPE
jgi:hypothetical protein